MESVTEDDEQRAECSDRGDGCDWADGGGGQAEQLADKLEGAHGEKQLEHLATQHKLAVLRECGLREPELDAGEGGSVGGGDGGVPEHKVEPELELADKHGEVELVQDRLGQLRRQRRRAVPQNEVHHHADVEQLRAAARARSVRGQTTSRHPQRPRHGARRRRHAARRVCLVFLQLSSSSCFTSSFFQCSCVSVLHCCAGKSTFYVVWACILWTTMHPH